MTVANVACMEVYSALLQAFPEQTGVQLLWVGGDGKSTLSVQCCAGAIQAVRLIARKV